MKVLMINSVCGIRSTGRICTDLADALTKQGHEVKIAYGREMVPDKYQKYAVRICSDSNVTLHAIQSRLFDNAGFGSKKDTQKFIEWINTYDPDVIHLHNLHGYYINIELLFNYLASTNKKVIWTLHDCWAFTGHCSYFSYIECDKWQNGCEKCPQKREYPTSWLLDCSNNNWEKKKALFSSVRNMTIVTPSKWLANLVGRSFLSSCSIHVIHNGIDTSVFKPVVCDGIRQKYNISNKKIILGVAAIWTKRKGLEDFLALNKLINKEEYQIVLVGLSRKQMEVLPPDIIGIRRTTSTLELSELYSLAFVFVNPTYEDNYPTTNLEAQACGTPVITYNTGGSIESACMFGVITDKKTAESINGELSNIDSVLNSKHEDFALKHSVDSMINQYIKLYADLKIPF